MKNFSFTLLSGLALFFGFEVSAQITFNTQYGGTDNEDGRWMEQTADSGFIMVGSKINSSMDIWLVKSDAFGNQQWQKSKGGNDYDFANMVRITSDGGYIIAGFTDSYGAGGNDGYLIKTDASGNTQWSQTYGNTGLQEFEAVVQTADGGYACVGINYSAGTGYYDIWLVKTNSSGVQQWQKNLGGGSYEIGNSIQIAPDGGYIIAGQSYSDDPTSAFYLLKTDASGNEQWHKTFATGHLCEAHYVQNVPGGGYIMCGDADTSWDALGETDLWLVRTDANGDSLWSKSHGGNKRDGGKTIEPTSDGGYIVAGITRSFGSEPDYFALKVDSGGIPEWSQHYGTGYHDHAYRGIETSDGGYAFFGFYRNQAADLNFGLVKIGSGGGVDKDISIERIKTPTNIICSSAGSPINLLISNIGGTYETNIVLYFEITGPNGTITLQDTLLGTLGPDTSVSFTFSPQLFNSLTPGTYDLKAYTIHRNGDASYTNDSLTSTLTVVTPSPDPTTTSAVSCAVPASLTLGASGADSIFWYNGTGTMVGSGPTFTTPSAFLSETYYAENDKGKGDKVGAIDKTIGGGSYLNGPYGLAFDARKYFKLISVLVDADVAGIRTIQLKDSSNNILQTGTYNLVAGPQRVFLNFDVPQLNDLKLVLAAGSDPLYRNVAGADYSNYDVSQTVEIFGPTAYSINYYFYFYDWYIFVPYENCVSNRIPATATVGTLGATTAFDVTRCGNGTVTLTATSSGSLQWYNAPTGGNLLATGSTYITPSLSSTTTYYLQVDACPTRIAVQAIIEQYSADPVTADSSRCGPGTLTLAASAAAQVYWYDAPTGGNLVGTGSPFTTPYLNFTSTFYVEAGNICPSNRIAVQAIVNSATAPVGTDVTACGPDSVMLSASSINNILWFDAAIGGNQVGAGPTFMTPVLTANATYYAEAQSTCVSVRTPVTAFITTINDPVAIDATHCGAGTLVLSGTSINTVNWYDVATGGIVISTGINFTTPLLTSTTVYYVEATDGICVSARIPVTATIIDYLAPVANSNYNCGPGTVTLSATAADTIYWFDAMVNGNLVGTGSPFTTLFLNSTTTFYAQTSLGCPSPRVAVDAIIGTNSADPITTGTDICVNDSGTVTALAADSISWYDDQGTLVGTGSSFTSPALTDTTVYFAVAGTMCPSQQVPATINVQPGSADPVTTNDSACTSGSLTLTATAIDPITWYDSLGTIVGTGSTFTTPVLSQTTTYYAVAMDHCASNQVPALAIINQVSADPVVIDGSVCGSGVITLSASAADSITWYDDQGGIVGTGNSFTTPLLTSSAVYFAVAGTACPSQQVAVNAIVFPLPSVSLGPDTIQTGATSYTLDAGAGFTSYLWSNTETTQTITVLATGDYCVTVTDSNSCSNSDCIYLDFMVGINHINQPGFVTILPNPTTGNISIHFSTTVDFKEMDVMDATGRLVFSRNISGVAFVDLNLSSVAKGVYFLRLTGADDVKTERIIIE